MQVLLDLLKGILAEPSVRVAIGGAIVNGLLYLWAALAPHVPWLPDPSPIFFEIGKWVELVLAGWAASRVKPVYLGLRATLRANKFIH